MNGLRPILAKQFGEDFYIEDVAGRNLRTGQIEQTIDAADAFTVIHHHRCIRNKATEQYIIMGRTGVEFIDLTGGPSMSHHWTRGMCQYGVMPANGLLYVPPHPCQMLGVGQGQRLLCLQQPESGPVERRYRTPSPWSGG